MRCIVKNKKQKTLKERTEALYDQQMAELERISGMTFEEAKGIFLSNVEQEIRHETAVLVKDLEQQAKEEAEKNAPRNYCIRNSTLCCGSCCRVYRIGSSSSK